MEYIMLGDLKTGDRVLVRSGHAGDKTIGVVSRITKAGNIGVYVDEFKDDGNETLFNKYGRERSDNYLRRTISVPSPESLERIRHDCWIKKNISYIRGLKLEEMHADDLHEIVHFILKVRKDRINNESQGTDDQPCVRETSSAPA